MIFYPLYGYIWEFLFQIDLPKILGSFKVARLSNLTCHLDPNTFKDSKIVPFQFSPQNFEIFKIILIP